MEGEIYDCVVVPMDVVQALGKVTQDRAEGIRMRYGKYLGIPEDGPRPKFRCGPVHGGPVAPGVMGYITEGPEAAPQTIRFPKSSPRADEDRYTWTKLQDGAVLGRLKPELTVDGLGLPPAVPVGDL